MNSKSQSLEPAPREYQQDALDELRKLRARGVGRALAVLASGLGKTFVSAFDAKQFSDATTARTRILYLTHQHVILEQARQTFRQVFGRSVSYGRFDGDVHEPDADLVFGLFQSMHKHLDEFDPRDFDYVIVDEAHHSAAPTRDAVISYFNPRFTLGLTATPLRGDGKDILTYYNDVVAINLPLERALVDGLLTPINYEVISDSVDQEKLLNLLRSARTPPQIEFETLFKPRVDQEIVRTIRERAESIGGTHKTIVFCSRIEEMNRFARLIHDSRTICGENSREDQISIVRAFSKGEFGTLLAVDVLNEGVDIPEVNMLVFLRNTESSVVFLQQLGRGLRKVHRKKHVWVLDFVNNVERFTFVYSFFTRLRAEEAVRRSQGRFSEENASNLELDSTARDVIDILLQKREESGYLVSLQTLAQALDNAVHPRTLLQIVRRGRLVPDMMFGDPAPKYYFEKPTYERFVRQIHASRHAEGLIPETDFARALGRTRSWLRAKERQGDLNPSWIHRRGNRTYWEYFYDAQDLADAREKFRLAS
jgi:superfamily II DNA or RNA helicase